MGLVLVHVYDGVMEKSRLSFVPREVLRGLQFARTEQVRLVPV